MSALCSGLLTIGPRFGGAPSPGPCQKRPARSFVLRLVAQLEQQVIFAAAAADAGAAVVAAAADAWTFADVRAQTAEAEKDPLGSGRPIKPWLLVHERRRVFELSLESV